jgi:hypothetical protein
MLVWKQLLEAMHKNNTGQTIKVLKSKQEGGWGKPTDIKKIISLSMKKNQLKKNVYNLPH